MTSVGESTSDVWVGGTSWRVVALNLLRLDHDFTVTEPPQLLEELSALARQCRSAATCLT